MELKDLQVEGRPWRVVLEYWCDGGTWYGRLLFIGPTGRRWTDAASSLTGSTPREVLGQALALPERALIGRVRELISE